MVNCWYSHQARLLITAAISVIHPAQFLTTKLILSAKLSKNEIIFLIRLYKIIEYQIYFHTNP